MSDETQVGKALKQLTVYDCDVLRSAGANGGTVCAIDYDTSQACHVLVIHKLMTDEGGDVFDLTGLGCAVADALLKWPDGTMPNEFGDFDEAGNVTPAMWKAVMPVRH